MSLLTELGEIRVDFGKIKTTTRIVKGVEQTIRLFTKSQRQLIMDAVDNRGETIKIEDVLRNNEVSPAVYYTWLKNKKNKQKPIDVTTIIQPKIDYQIVTESSSDGLTTKVKSLITNGWSPVGSHTCVVTNSTNRISGLQIHGTNYKIEYSQTMIKS